MEYLLVKSQVLRLTEALFFLLKLFPSRIYRTLKQMLWFFSSLYQLTDLSERDFLNSLAILRDSTVKSLKMQIFLVCYDSCPIPQLQKFKNLVFNILLHLQN